jgi:hypothetical protein
MRPGSSSFTGSTCRYRASWTIRNITDWPVGIARPVYLRDADHAASIQNEESQTNDKRRRENRGMAHSVRRPHTAWVWEHADRRFRPRSYYRLVDPFPPSHALTDDEFEQAFIERPTVLYFHGNVRRPPFCQDELRSDTEDRLRTAPHLSVCGGTAHSRHSWIDYRGFGDSTGSPSEDGVVRDARAAWDYVAGHVERLARDRGEKVEAENMIILVGQSMGTGVASLLAGQLAQDGELSVLHRICLSLLQASIPELSCSSRRSTPPSSSCSSTGSLTSSLSSSR